MNTNKELAEAVWGELHGYGSNAYRAQDIAKIESAFDVVARDVLTIAATRLSFELSQCAGISEDCKKYLVDTVISASRGERISPFGCKCRWIKDSSNNWHIGFCDIPFSQKEVDSWPFAPCCGKKRGGS